MKKLLFTLAVSLVGFISLTQAQKGPEIKFDQLSHDFGAIEEGPDYKYKFTFKNTGDQPLTISNVSSPCGCTVPKWTNDPVLPGKTGEINVEYHSGGKGGVFEKIMTVQTNLPADKNVNLTIKGDVKPKGTIVKSEEKPAPVEPVKEAPAPPVKKSKKHKGTKS